MAKVENKSWDREASLLRPAQLTAEFLSEQPTLDTTRPWAPRDLPPLAGSGMYSMLTEEQRLRYNHIYARQLIAQFIWAESVLALPGLLRLLRLPHPHDTVLPILQSFISDETNHIKCFSKLDALARAVEPPPAGQKVPLFHPPILVRTLTKVAARFPDKFVSWIEMVEQFEVYTLKVGQLYMQDEAVDSVFRNVFLAHARDEARHCRLDRLLCEWLQSRWHGIRKALNDRMVDIFGASFMSVEWGLSGPVRELKLIYPEIPFSFNALLAESKLVRTRSPTLEMKSQTG